MKEHQAECQAIAYSTDIAPLLEGLEGNPFQSAGVLASWFAAFAGRGDARECFLVTLRNSEGMPVLALPLTRTRKSGVTILSLPDSGVIDFSTPFMRRNARPHLPAPASLMTLVSQVLPKAELLIFRRLAPGGPGLANPFYAHGASQPSRLVSWRTDGLCDLHAHEAGLAKAFRKKLRRNREKFLALEGARIVVPRTVNEAMGLLESLEAMQGARIRARGLPYGLDCPRIKAFYRSLVTSGIESGATQMVGLMVGESVLAASFAILSQGEAVYLRVASDFDAHSALTPGLLVTDAAMREANARGIHSFDFGMGSYAFKWRMGGKPQPLRDLVLPLTPLGILPASYLRIKLFASTNSFLRKLCAKEELAADTP